MIKQICKMTVLMTCLCQSLYAAEYVIQNDVIKTKISYQNLNRIKVKGCKIDRIYGLENAFYLEKHDKTGEAFIKPTAENGYAPISISIVTVSGQTQDLLLEPDDIDAQTIELIADDQGNNSVLHDITSDVIAGDYEENICAVMRRLISAKASHLLALQITDRKYGSLTAEFESACNIAGYIGLKFNVYTHVGGAIELDERMFAMPGDIALSLSALTINNGQKVTLYVLRK